MDAAAVPASEQPYSGVARSEIQLEHTGISLPQMWIGFALATAALIAETGRLSKVLSEDAAFTARILSGFFAWFYWLFCIYRIHKVLAHATRRSYKVSPFRAAWPQFVPVYNWVWAVQWPSRLAKFLKTVKPDLRIARRWPGIILVLATFAGMLLGSTSLRLFVIFGVGTYLNRKIREVIIFTKAVPMSRKKHFDLALSTGLGAGFGLVLCQAAQTFSGKGGGEQLREVLVILLVSLGIIKFVEPLSDWVRHAFHAEHHSVAEQRSTLLRIAIFLAIVFSGFSHEFLDEQIKENMWGAVRTLAAMLIISGGITYAWIAGAKRRPARASRLGLVSGGGLALLLILVLFIAFDNQVVEAGNNPASAGASKVFSGAMEPVFVPWIIGSHVNSMSTVAVPLLLWSILGLVGGLAIDRKWGGGSPRHVALSVLSTAFIVILALRLANMGNAHEISLGGAAVLGWCISLLIYPESERVLKTA
jgi:hypothetical protein